MLRQRALPSNDRRAARFASLRPPRETQEQALRASPGPRLQAALETLSADVVAVAPAEVVQRCCDTVTSQGVVALVDRPVLPLPASLQTVLICDGVQDPGACVRVCVATGLSAWLKEPPPSFLCLIYEAETSSSVLKTAVDLGQSPITFELFSFRGGFARLRLAAEPATGMCHRECTSAVPIPYRPPNLGFMAAPRR